MYFCETCQQPLCVLCRSITHNAKIFNKHHIVEIQEYGRIRGETICKNHGSPFILYCLESKRLICIECFNNSVFDQKHNFVNIDLAYKICCDKLEKYASKLRVFQSDLNEQIELRCRMLTQIDENSHKLKIYCEEQCNDFIKQIESLKGTLIKQINEDKDCKTQNIIDEINSLNLLEGPIKVDLLSTSIFCTYASKIDLLGLYSELYKSIQHTLSKRLHVQKAKSIAPMEIDLNACFMEIFEKAGFIFDNKKADEASQFPICDDIFSVLQHNTLQNFSPISPCQNHAALLVEHRANTNEGGEFYSKSEEPISLKNIFLLGSTETTGIAAKLFMKDEYARSLLNGQEQNDSYFADLLSKIEAPTTKLTAELSGVYLVVSNFQRDITSRRRFVDDKELEQIIDGCANLWRQVQSHQRFIQQSVHPKLRSYWQKKIAFIQSQQLIVRDQVQGLLSLQKISQKALSTMHKLKPFAKQLNAIVNILHTRYSICRNAEMEPGGGLFEAHSTPMDDVCTQIKLIDPGGQDRLATIEEEMEKRKNLQREEWKREEEEQEAVVARNHLKEVRQKRRHCISPVVAEPNRDRPSIEVEHIKLRKNQKTYDRACRLSESMLYDKLVQEANNEVYLRKRMSLTDENPSTKQCDEKLGNERSLESPKQCDEKPENEKNLDVQTTDQQIYPQSSQPDVQIKNEEKQSIVKDDSDQLSEEVDDASGEIVDKRRFIGRMLDSISKENIEAKERLLENIKKCIKRID